MRSLDHLRVKAVELRTKQFLSLDDICARVNLPRTTVYYWIKDLPIPRTEKQKYSQKAGTAATVAKWAALRKQAYEAAYESASQLLQDQAVRDFVVLYLAEGYRKDRNKVQLGNSNPRIVALAHSCMRRLSDKPRFMYFLQYHADQDLDELKRFWSQCLGIGPDAIKVQRKSNSGQLAHRRWASKYGVLSVGVGDTLFRSRLEALMDTVQEQWASVDRA
jgi:AcrR family transcriptional regulator